jgi:hypothetical protein
MSSSNRDRLDRLPHQLIRIRRIIEIHVMSRFRYDVDDSTIVTGFLELLDGSMTAVFVHPVFLTVYQNRYLANANMSRASSTHR